MALEDASHQIIADLLESRTGQSLGESRRWRISSALSGLFREFGIDNVDQLACIRDGRNGLEIIPCCGERHRLLILINRLDEERQNSEII